MQFFPFQVIGKTQPIQITWERIISAMKHASSNGRPRESGRKYAVMNPQTGETFAPKDILRIIIGDEKCRFFGGKGPNGANRPFEAFGFPVGDLDTLVSRRKQVRHWEGQIPSTEVLLQRLFDQKWRSLPNVAELKKIEGGSFPGVYVLAYSEDSLEAQKVQEVNVFYVGMTCEAGLSKRLSQFRQGVDRGGCHSGADRFFRLWLKKKPYKPSAQPKLYFAYLPIECEKEKPWRSPEDIAMLRRVPELEFATIAQVKRFLGHEPLLNKK